MIRTPYFQKQMDENPDKYPKRHGMPWDEEELQQLLIEIARKLSYEEIAEKHERTLGGITARLKEIVRNYYDEGKTIEKIIKYTGLSQKVVEETIYKHKLKKDKSVVQKETNPIVKSQEKSHETSTIGNEDVCHRLWKIECLLVKILDRLEKLGGS